MRSKLHYNSCQHHFQEGRKRHLLSQILSIQKEGPLCQQLSSEKKPRVKTQVSVLVPSIPVIKTRKLAVKNTTNNENL